MHDTGLGSPANQVVRSGTAFLQEMGCDVTVVWQTRISLIESFGAGRGVSQSLSKGKKQSCVLR